MFGVIPNAPQQQNTKIKLFQRAGRHKAFILI